MLCEYRRKSVSEVKTHIFEFQVMKKVPEITMLNINLFSLNVLPPQVSLGKNSVVTVVEGSPTAEWWRVETEQGVQVGNHSIRQFSPSHRRRTKECRLAPSLRDKYHLHIAFLPGH